MEDIESKQKKIIEATRLLGRNEKYIKQALKEKIIKSWGITMMVEPLKSIKDEKGRPLATTRLLHYANTMFIAIKIAQGVFPKDKEFAKGVGVAALLHDFGQGPFGHNGEAAFKFASKQNNGGARLHNIEGSMQLWYRYSNNIKDAINSGKIIEDEAKKRNISKKELKNRINSGLEPEIANKIHEEVEKNKELADEAVKIIVMAAGNHNGERGKSHIKPNLDRTFEEFMDTAKKTYINVAEDKNMESCNIVDAIVKISDQISSITFDVIDGKTSGIEDKIYDGWAEPISKILHITENEAKNKLKGNAKELRKLARDLQDKFIDDIIKNSSKDEIKMSIAHLLYGSTDSRGQVIENGLRTFNMTEHTAYTSTAIEEVILNNTVSALTDVLSKTILDKNGIFPPKLNEIFRISENNPIRKLKAKELNSSYDGNVILKDFYKYVTELSPDEYKMNKDIVKKMEVQYYRNIIEKALNKRDGILDNTEIRSPRKSTEYLIEEYMLSPSYEAMTPDENGNYSDEEVKNMMDRINAFLGANPVEGIKHLSLLVQRKKYQVGIEGEAEKVSTNKIRMNTDQQIAARIAISYLEGLFNNGELIDLASNLGILKEEEEKYFKLPYIKYSGKRTGQGGHKTKSMKYSQVDYLSGSGSCYTTADSGEGPSLE